MVKIAKMKVKRDQAHSRLDIFLSENLSITRSQAKKMFDYGVVFVNGVIPIKAGYKVQMGDVIEIKQVEDSKNQIADGDNIQDSRFKIKVIEENRDYLVVSKPAGMLVHPTMAHESDTLVNWLLKEYPETKNVGESKVRPGIVHRLDREASGVMVVARSQKMFEHLKQQFKDREVEKEYKVLVYGNLEKEHDIIDFDIDRGNDGRMVSRPKIDKLKLKNVGKDQPGKVALTEYWVEERYIRFNLLNVKIHTGRTHQIRVHMFACGHPVFGDTLYINKKLIKKSDAHLGRLFLHAEKLCFTDLKGEKKCFTSVMPDKLKKHLKNLK